MHVRIHIEKHAATHTYEGTCTYIYRCTILHACIHALSARSLRAHERVYSRARLRGMSARVRSLAYFAAEASWFPAPARRPRSGLAARPPFSAARGAMATRDPSVDYKVLYLRNMSFRLDKESGGRGRGAKKLRNARARARLLNILCAVRAGVHNV